MESFQYVMVSGTGRCGTNITKQILSQHSRVSTLPFELRFIIDPNGLIDFYSSIRNTWSPFMVDRKIKKLGNFLTSLSNRNFSFHMDKLISSLDSQSQVITTASYSGWELDKWFPNYSKYVKELLDDLIDFKFKGAWPGTKSYSIDNEMFFMKNKSKEELDDIFSSFISKLVRDFIDDSRVNTFIDDNTWSILFADKLFRILPNPKLVHLIRDPRDVVASFTQQRWCPSDTKKAACYYKSIMDRWLGCQEELPEDNYYELKLEDLVGKTKSYLQELCNFLELSFNDPLLDIKLDKAHSGRWKNDFSPKDQKWLDKELNEYLEFFDYR